MHWPVLVFSSLFEAFVPLLVIRSENYTNPLYLSFLLVTVVSSIVGLRYAMRVIPLGIAYTVWTALGILGTVVLGVTVLDESLEPIEIFSLMLIVLAVIGLRISSSESVKASTAS